MSNGNFCEVQLGLKPEREGHKDFASPPGHVTQMAHEWSAADGKASKLEDTRINTADQANGLPGYPGVCTDPVGLPQRMRSRTIRF